MEINQAKQLLKDSLDYNARAKSLSSLRDELAEFYGSTRVGSDAINLGLLKHFYLNANGVLHMVTNEADFAMALRRVEALHAEETKASQPIVVESPPALPQANAIKQALSRAMMTRRPSLGYSLIKSGEHVRATTVEDQIMEDLLFGDAEKAVEAFRSILIK